MCNSCWYCTPTVLSLQLIQLHWCLHTDSMQSDSDYSSGTWNRFPAFRSQNSFQCGFIAWILLSKGKCAVRLCTKSFPFVSVETKQPSSVHWMPTECVRANFGFRTPKIKNFNASIQLKETKMQHIACWNILHFCSIPWWEHAHCTIIV